MTATTSPVDPETEPLQLIDDGTECRPSPPADVLGTDEAEALARRLRALADPVRLRLLSTIVRTADAEACVCDLTEVVRLSQPTVSHHLKVLMDAGLVTRSKRGVWAWYSLTDGWATELSEALALVALPTHRDPA
ncbi:ArsR/SmtB family transcription factor [Propionibacteriaceae bacterium Y2011]|uniref:ArsR/SmtB family transcription factor n=1 Tax=Microlunatus sp. Y2014 TaxID=3418488 RepID=UPI003B4A7E5B